MKQYEPDLIKDIEVIKKLKKEDRQAYLETRQMLEDAGIDDRMGELAR